MPESIIFHIDVNSAFLSWEAVRRLKEHPDAPDIREIASAIGGDEKSRHGIVLAKSVLAKRCGVRTGEPLIQARRKCPTLSVFSPDFSTYVAYSSKFMAILREVAPAVEQFSIDEAFCDMTGTTSLYGDPVAFAHKLKDRIYRELGFTVNIGISSNKLLAKMASDFEKPNKVHTLFPSELPQKFWPLPVDDLLYVGSSTSRKLRSYGITTIGDLARTRKESLIALFKSQGEMMWNYANGIDNSPVVSERAANKCYGNSITIHFDVTDSETAKHVLLSLCETVGARIRADKVFVSVIQVSITDCEFHQMSHQLTLPSPTNVTERIYESACHLFDEMWNRVPIRLLGVSTSKPTQDTYEQYDLFDRDKFERLSRLNSAVDSIRDRFGDDSIKRACFLETDAASIPSKHLKGGLNYEKQKARKKENEI